MRSLRQTLLLIALLWVDASALGQGNSVYAWKNFTGQPGGMGNADGASGAARFSNLSGVAVDSAGTVYVADTYNNTIRKVTSGGMVTTLAGSPGQSGSADGTGNAARFSYPSGVAVDSAGTVYVADTYNNTIRKVTTGGMVTTLAGSPGQSGSADGTGSAALFNGPRGVALDASGNVYVADSGNCTIRKVTSSGVVATLAGSPGQSGSADGTGGAAQFYYPSGVAVDGTGNVFVADMDNECLRKVTGAGAVTTLAGTAIREALNGGVVISVTGSADGTGGAAQFYSPSGVAVDGAGNVYVADSGNCTIRKVTSSGAVTTLAGSAGQSGSADGSGGGARFNSPGGVAVDSNGNVYVADSGNSTLRNVTSSGVVTTLAGSAGQPGSADAAGSAARFDFPYGVAVDQAGSVYVADTDNNTIRKVSNIGMVTTLAGSAGQPGSADGAGGAAQFYSPSGMAVDERGNIYIADFGNSTIRKVTGAGVVTTLAGSAGQLGSADGAGGVARFNGPYGVAVDGAGSVYVADAYNSTVRVVTSAGMVMTLAGKPGQLGSTDGTGSGARFYYPSGVAVDDAGGVYVADAYNDTIRKVTPDGVVTTLAGTPGQAGTTDGTGAAARFNGPYGVAVNGAGSVYVADAYNSTIRMFTSDGVVTTLAGTPGQVGSMDGTGGGAQFYFPFDYRAKFLQDWTISPELPQGGAGLWRLDVNVAGSGVTGDLLAHCIDTAIWLNGGIETVNAMTETFIKERKHNLTGKVQKVGIDDACAFLARFDNGSLATFESTRYARGHKALYTFEINGEHASIAWDLHDLHRLQYFDHRDEGRVRGWRSIHVTDGDQPYMKHWWVPGLQIGYEHSFVHQVADFLKGLADGKPAGPTFRDALETQYVCDAVLKSAKTHKWQKV